MVPGEWLHWINEEGATRNHHQTRDALTNYYPVGRRGHDAASFFAGFVVATGGWAWLPIEVSY